MNFFFRVLLIRLATKNDDDIDNKHGALSIRPKIPV